jgi:single-stranded DNA-binding protein
MAADNQVTIVGNLTDDPELRFTRAGRPWRTSAWP